MYAVNRGDPAIVRLLIQRGADPNRPEDMLGSRCLDPCNTNACYGWASTEGLTPLMLAAVWGNAEVVRILLEAGADPLLRDAGGRTARDAAESKGKSAVVSLLSAAEQAAR